MTADGYGYGYMRATDQDRENVRSILADAHAQGRLDYQELDARTNALLNAQTYDQLAALTADLPNRIPGSPPQVWQPGPAAAGTTNGMAIAAMICGIVQFFGFWLVGTIPAIILGHLARRQIRQTGEQGAGMAMAGIILGWVGVGLSVLFVILIIALLATAPHTYSIHSGPNG